MAKLKRKVERTFIDYFEIGNLDGPVKDVITYLKTFDKKNYEIETEWGYDGLEWAHVIKVVKESNKDYEARCKKYDIDNAERIKARKAKADAKKLSKKEAIEAAEKELLAELKAKYEDA